MNYLAPFEKIIVIIAIIFPIVNTLVLSTIVFYLSKIAEAISDLKKSKDNED